MCVCVNNVLLLMLFFLSLRFRLGCSFPVWRWAPSLGASWASQWSRWRTTTTTGSSSRTGAAPEPTASRQASMPWLALPHVWVRADCATPGLYAMVGAAAVLGKTMDFRRLLFFCSSLRWNTANEHKLNSLRTQYIGSL